MFFMHPSRLEVVCKVNQAVYLNDPRPLAACSNVGAISFEDYGIGRRGGIVTQGPRLYQEDK
jgi:hypothetical protein